MEVTTLNSSSSCSCSLNKKNQCYVKYLPDEVVLEIISRLPSDLEIITRLKFVSKSFCKMIEDSSMMQKVIAREEPGVLIVSHDSVTSSTTLYHARDEHNVKPIYQAPFHSEYLVECYFKGLVCFCRRDDLEEQAVICNPLTREHVALPSIVKSQVEDEYGDVPLSMYAIGCGRLSKEYKVLQVHNITLVQPKVYTLGKSTSWRDISSFPPYVFYSKTVFSYGAVHWKIDPCYGEIECKERILSFDVDKEEFYFTEHPEELGDRTKNDLIDIIQFGECLAFADFSFKTHIDIWVHHDDAEKQWVKEYVIKFEIPKHPKDRSLWRPPTMSDFAVIGLWQQGEILISRHMELRRHAYDPLSWNNHCFYSYDSNIGCVREVTAMFQISPSTTIQRVCGYSRSLMSLKPYG